MKKLVREEHELHELTNITNIKTFPSRLWKAVFAPGMELGILINFGSKEVEFKRVVN